MNLQYPNFDQVDIFSYPKVWGFYTLGMMKHHHPDIHFIMPDQWESIEDYAWLTEEIRQGLNNNKKVCVVPWDEIILTSISLELSKSLNQFKNDPVWLVTQLPVDRQKLYTFQYQIDCKIVEVPWWMVNESLCYYGVSLLREVNITESDTNYVCMLGRYEPHKLNLAKQLHQHNLAKFGKITASKGRWPTDWSAYCESHFDNEIFKQYLVDAGVNSPKIKDFKRINGEAAKVEYNNRLISVNTKNYVILEDELQNVPMIINTETSCGIFLSTEKSIWPILLGKIFLLSGQVGIMDYVQRFLNYNLSDIVDLDFDQVGGYTNEDHVLRLQKMLTNNRKLIENCLDVYQEKQSILQQNRIDFGKNMYNFLVNQLETI